MARTETRLRMVMTPSNEPLSARAQEFRGEVCLVKVMALYLAAVSV